MANKRDMKKLLIDLQNLIGSKPKLGIAKFKNWASTQMRDEIISVSPTSVQEVQAVVRAARKLGVRIRAAGKTHSRSPLFTDESGIVVHTVDIKRPEGNQLELIQDPMNPAQKWVTMAAGVTTGDLLEFQLTHGVCIPGNVIPKNVSMAGLVAPACHGVGSDVKTVSDNVVKIRIVNSDGELIEYTIAKDEDMMRAVQANLGLWGIIIDMTMKVNPMVLVETDNVWMKVKDIFYDKDKLREIVTKNWSVQIHWFPFNGITNGEALEAFMEGHIDCGEWNPKEDEVWLRLINISKNVHTAEPSECHKDFGLTGYLQNKGFKDIDNFVKTFPQVAPSFLRSQVQQTKKFFSNKHIQQLPHAIHYQEGYGDVATHVMEWAIPIENDFSNVLNSIHHVIEVVHREALSGRFPMNLPLNLRFMADSDVYMAPIGQANPKYGGSGRSFYIEILSVVNTPHWYEFLQNIADNWMVNPGARPHWCKEWNTLKGIDDFIRKSYSQVMPKYLSCLERSGADPDGIFFNDRLEKIFYPQGHPGWAKVREKQSNGTETRNQNKIEHMTCVLI